MFSRTVRTKTLALPLVFALVIAACGGDDDADDTSDTGDSATTEATETAEDTADEPDTAEDTADEPDTAEDTADEPDTAEDTAEASEPAGDADVCTEDRIGGSLSFAVPSLVGSLDPYNPASSGVLGVLAPLYDSLVRYDSSTGEFIPQLAESVTPNDDATEWTIVLKPGVTFGNGDPLDAAAVKASIDRHLAEGSTSNLLQYSALISEVSVVDDLTVTVTSFDPWGSFPGVLTSGLGYITNVAVVDEVGADTFGIDPTGGGAGPYEVTNFSPPELIEFTAKTDWWGGPVCIQTLTYNGVPLADTALDSFVREEFDAALIDARDPIATAEAKALDVANRSIIQNGGGIVLLNARPDSGAATTDVRVRQAIAAAIDVNSINERAFDGRSFPQAGIIADASQSYTGTEGPTFDPDLAASLVEEVKAEGTWDGSVRFACVESLSDASIAMTAMLEASGFQVELQSNLTLQQEIGIVLEGNYELACFGQTPSEASFWEGLRGYYSTNPRNLSGFVDPDMDAALDVLRGAVTVDEVQAGVEGVQEVWNESVPAAVYSAFEHVMVWHDNVKGLTFDDSITVTPFFDTAYVD